MDAKNIPVIADSAHYANKERPINGNGDEFVLQNDQPFDRRLAASTLGARQQRLPSRNERDAYSREDVNFNAW